MQKLANVLISLACAWLIACASAKASDFSDWRDGDLIFHESQGPQASAIRAVTGSKYTHVGIVRLTGGGPFVIEAGPTVQEVPVEDFIARGRKHFYAVYRVNGLTQQEGVAAAQTAWNYYDRPYDIFFRLDPASIYCSELPYYAFKAIGIQLGRVERLGDLNLDSPQSRKIFQMRWREHPDCRNAGLDSKGCWVLIRKQKIVTPASIADGSNVERVFSNFPEKK